MYSLRGCSQQPDASAVTALPGDRGSARQSKRQEGELLTESLIARIKAPHSTAAWPVSLAKFEGTSETGSAAFFQSP